VGGEGYKRQFGVQETLLVCGYDPVSTLGRLYVFAVPHAERGKAALKTLLKRMRDPLSQIKRALHGAPLASEAS
jgi:CelD/BcsL family acetyltransferase involved in cellulose biosynthesis